MARKHIILPDDLAERLRRFRHKHEISSEAEAIRKLLEAGMDHLDEQAYAAASREAGSR